MIARGWSRATLLFGGLFVLAFRLEAQNLTEWKAEHPTGQSETSQSLPRRFPVTSSLNCSLPIEAAKEKGHLALPCRQQVAATLRAEPERGPCQSCSPFLISGIGRGPHGWQDIKEGGHSWPGRAGWVPRETHRPEIAPQSRLEPEMLIVPGGIYERGDDHGSPDQRPAHPVYLGTFEISTSEVTNQLYRFFIEATGHPAPEGPRYGWKEGSYPRGQGNAPVVFVSWEDAVAFCRWLSRETGHTYRLPTEAEWEKAAQMIGERYASVGSIWEWCQDWYDRDAYRLAPRISPQGPPKGQRVRVIGMEGPTRVIRGGGFGRSSLSRRVAVRGFFPPDRTRFDLGFRVVRELGPAPPRTTTPTIPN